MLRPKTDLTCFHLETSIELNAVTWLGNLAGARERTPAESRRSLEECAREG